MSENMVFDQTYSEDFQAFIDACKEANPYQEEQLNKIMDSFRTQMITWLCSAMDSYEQSGHKMKEFLKTHSTADSLIRLDIDVKRS